MTSERTIESSQDDGPHQRLLNDLYWRSDRTVDEIVDELEVGRNTLYASVSPLPAGLICKACGNQIVFTNRTQRAAGIGSCEGCGRETSARGESEGDADALPGTRSDGQRGWDRWLEDVGGVAPRRALLIGAAAVLGLVAGTAAARLFRD